MPSLDQSKESLVAELAGEYPQNATDLNLNHLYNISLYER